MRLTLRNLLAYLDGILEPDDAQDIAKKLEESQYAADLMHRIRDLMRRMRLAAPSVSDRGPGLDPNTVAEYLDNTLPPDRVVDFEKVCLESDIHLAEVAACHQILSLVLGEPMEIDPAVRQRMNVIGEMAAGAEISPLSSAGGGPPPIPTPPPPVVDAEKQGPRVRPVVPDYLREPRRKYRWLARLGIAAGILCVLAALLAAFGQFEPGTLIGNWLVSWKIIEGRQEVAAAPGMGKEEGKTQDASVETKEKEGKDPGSEANQAVVKEEPGPEPLIPEENATKGKPGTEEKNAEPVPKAETPPAEGSQPPSTIPPEPAPLPPDKEIPKETKESPPPAATGKGEIPAAPLPNQRPDAPPSGTAPAAPAPAPGIAPAVAPANEGMGRLMSDDQILLGGGDDETNWQRMNSKEILSSGRPLLALPTYRPEIALSAGVTLQLVGGTRVKLLPGNATELPGVEVRFGRVILMPLANSGVKLRLALPNRTGVLTFNDADAEVALEVRREVPLGTNPEGDGARYVIELFVPAGQATWEETGQAPLDCKSPAHFVMEGKSAPKSEGVKEFSQWITAEMIGTLERGASQAVLQEMNVKVPARQSLLVLSEDRRKEVRTLAGRCLGYLGYFDPEVSALGNLTFRYPEWDPYIELLREAVIRDAPTAAAVRLALEKQYGSLAGDLFRMLWGYTDKDLAQGEDARLVGMLDHENLAVRVLSFWNLHKMTGLSLYYRPENPEGRRRQPVQVWRQRLEAGDIRIKTPEAKTGIPVKEKPA